MFKIITRSCRLFSTLVERPYEKYINDHIKKSLQSVSTPSKLKGKQTCEKYFQKLTPSSQPEQQSSLKIRFNMIFSACFQLQNFDQHREMICQMILQDKIKSQSQLDRILKFLLKEIKWNSRIGIKEIQLFLQETQKRSEQFRIELKKDFVQKLIEFAESNVNNLCKKYREKFPQVDSKLIFDEVKNICKKSTYDPQKKTQFVKSKIQKPSNHQASAQHEQNKFWNKIHNIKPRLIKQELNDPEVYSSHKQITQGKLRFRFPPQPNGYLHIGHVKSIRMNFESAKRMNGECYLRYDDTNPEKQSQEFIDEIEKNVRWMGYVPDKVNFTSDYFEQMMYFANQLVKEGKAYVCESSQEQIETERREKKENVFRLKQKSFSQNIFPYLNPNQTLRLKLDPASANPTLRDPIIYRFKSHPHPRTGLKYSIYPMYDFAHCISDSLQHIDYSLCSLQFEIRRELYYKILDLLGLYKPIVWEFSRLNVKGNVISKRKIKQLIDEKKISGWDDPRLLTIKGMQRRGYTPNMLNQFVDKVNSSRSGNQKFVRFQVLEKQMKKQLSKYSQRVIALKHPYRIQLINNQLLKQSIFVQKEEIQKIEPGKEIILKNCGVYKVQVSDKKQIKLTQSTKSIQDVKKQKQKLPILSWLPKDHIEKKVIFFSSLLTENDQFNPNSRRQETLFVEQSFEKEPIQTKNENKIYFFERIGYFKKDSKTGEVICCAQI